MVGNPSPMYYINMVSSGMILNCPVAPEEVSNTNTTFGPDVASLKGKTTRKHSNPVVKEYLDIPQTILDINNKVTLVEGVVVVNGLYFFIGTLRRINFTTLE